VSQAAEQFAVFSEEREALLGRVAELDKSDGSIRGAYAAAVAAAAVAAAGVGG
jgi:hypothetical protein